MAEREKPDVIVNMSLALWLRGRLVSRRGGFNLGLAGGDYLAPVAWPKG